MRKLDEKKVSIFKVVAISAGVAVFVVTAAMVLYRLFKKYFRISFDCGDCDSCCQDCFGDEFDPLSKCDDDFAPGCSLCDESDAEESAAADEAESADEDDGEDAE